VDRSELVDRARRGDRHAFAELVRASGARLDATARLILRDPELAQDGEVADRDLLDRALARLEPEARADLL
jgi:DNA-directed RNA polymerase specialized sigma24 family protein